MEIKLNQYTLALLCALISYITYIILKLCGKPKDKIQRELSWASRTERDKDEVVYEEEEDVRTISDTSDDYKQPYDVNQSLKTKDSIYKNRKRWLSFVEETDEGKERNDSSNEGGLENEDPEKLLEQRVERSRKTSDGPQTPRDVIAFEDELQAALEKVDGVSDVGNDGIKTIIPVILMKNEKLDSIKMIT